MSSKAPLFRLRLDELSCPAIGRQFSALGMQIDKDHSGDSHFEFDPADQAAIAEAMERFRRHTG
jgi:hypothetical protein